MNDDEGYYPADFFLRMMVQGDVQVGVKGFPRKNLERLIELTSDADIANRDWAIFLLSQSDVNTKEVRKTLLRAATDESIDVRVEALVGLAMRDRIAALPLVRRELLGHWFSKPLFEAAAYIGDPRLCEAIKSSLNSIDASENDPVYQSGLEALDACQKGVPMEPPVEFDR